MNVAVGRITAIFTLFALSLLLPACSEPRTELPVNTRLGGDFSMVDQDGKPFGPADLQGKLSLMFFGFTQCPDICPATLARTVGVWKELTERQREQVQVVFVSFDPQRDTPAYLKEYLAFFDPGVIGLTGSAEQVASMARGYGVVYLQEDTQPGREQDYLFSHSDFVYLLDQQGRVRKLFKSDFDGEELINDVRSLL
ncbi:SCO family protein [Alcanivorax sp. 1008]|uniref:SCO family protein n=1 Tax=Alcanivorax sp. 1008 TaxID=2816853 RepID=UPI001D8F17A3|nr:SCO family protein [Alcanivorax sp. 1008]MCC1496530.1 SCO family protein [Alcanivorax sp. 1008]